MTRPRWKWIRFPAGDHLALRRRLNRLAQAGWVLSPTGDGPCLLARFCPTARTELRYDTEIAPLWRSAQTLEQTVRRREESGWKAIATLNGVDIYASMPCRAPQPEVAPHRGREFLRALLSLLTVALTALLCWHWSAFGSVWYLSNRAAWLWASRFPISVGAALWLAWTLLRLFRPASSPAAPVFVWLRAAWTTGILFWWMVWITAFLFDVLPTLWAALILAAVWLGWLIGQHFLDRRALLLLLTGILLLAVLLLPALLPDRSLYGTHGATWRTSLPDAVPAESLDLDGGKLLWAEYERDGSVLVRRSLYREEWDLFWLESESDICLTTNLAAQVERDCARRDPSALTVRSGRRVLTLRLSQDVPRDKLERVLRARLEER